MNWKIRIWPLKEHRLIFIKTEVENDIINKEPTGRGLLFNDREEHSHLFSLANLRFYNLTRLQARVKDSLARWGKATTRKMLFVGVKLSSQHY